MTAKDKQDLRRVKRIAVEALQATASSVAVNSFATIDVGGTLVAADSATDVLTLVAGANVTINANPTNDTITISSTGGGGGGTSDHGALTGLADDDHTQYFNEARGDVRYAKVATVGEATLDFTTGNNEASVVVSTPIPANTPVRIWVVGSDTTPDHTANDHVYFTLFAHFSVVALVANTSFTIKAVSLEKLTKTFKVRWAY